LINYEACLLQHTRQSIHSSKKKQKQMILRRFLSQSLPKPSKFLVGVDGSDNAKRAVLAALDLMNKQSDEILLLSVPILVSAEPALGEEFAVKLNQTRLEFAKNHLSDAEQICKSNGANQIRCILGNPSLGPRSEVVDHAIECKADYVVLGSRGFGQIKRMVIGSTVDYALYHVPCNLIVIK
jgi:nucleotide-binding universal stress UspA family protein